ncbi:MAG TPA: SGNH hydrolase domain-containing protein, partial [Candidatus Angelobacter sp.]|nr:SGNH hydrolase domain-containing protein [Candidatus Angelobacter sp.]
ALKRPYDECDTWRAAVLAEIARTHPALVVAAGTRTASLVDRSTGSLIDPSRAPAEWQAGWARTLGTLSATGVHVAVLRDTPWPGRDVPACVQQHRGDPSACDLARSALDSPAYDIGTTTRFAGAHGVDLTSVICLPTRCPVTLGKYLVYRDTSHLTATFARALAPYLGQQLAPLVHP